MRKKDNDDDDFFGGGRAIGKRAGGGGGGFGSLSSKPKKEIEVGALPRFGKISGVDFALRAVSADQLVSVTQNLIKIESEVIDKTQWHTGAAVIGAATALLQLRASCNSNPASLPMVHLQTDLGIKTLGLQDKYLSWCNRARQCQEARCATCPSLNVQLALVRTERKLQETREELKKKLSDDNLQQMPEFQQRVDVLQRLGHLSEDMTVTMKGRATCEIRSGDELLASELIFSGALGSLTPEEAVAVLAALVFQEKSDNAPRLTERLTTARDAAIKLAKDIGALQRDCGLQVAPDEYAMTSLNWGLSEVAYEWAKGTSFHDICSLTDVMEGSIVRTIVRLEELCREVKDAARVMGNPTLYNKATNMRDLLRRDIVFSASLYLQ